DRSPEPKDLVVAVEILSEPSFERLQRVVNKENQWFLNPRGINAWTRKSPPNYVERSHALLVQTADEGRVRDIISAFMSLQKEKKAPQRLVGIGQGGILVAYAALFEPSIKQVVIVDPPKSHRDGPTFLNVMRILDIPDALGLLAPDVKLTIVNAKD